MKRKSKRTGQSPYQKYKKAPFQYSARYYEWPNSVMGKVKRQPEQRKVS